MYGYADLLYTGRKYIVYSLASFSLCSLFECDIVIVYSQSHFIKIP